MNFMVDNTDKILQEGDIEKLIITLTEKKYAEDLKNDIIESGVPKSEVKIRTDKDTNQCKLTVYNAQFYMNTIVDMFRGPGYELTIPEIEKLLNVRIEIQHKELHLSDFIQK